MWYAHRPTWGRCADGIRRGDGWWTDEVILKFGNDHGLRYAIRGRNMFLVGSLHIRTERLQLSEQLSFVHD